MKLFLYRHENKTYLSSACSCYWFFMLFIDLDYNQFHVQNSYWQSQVYYWDIYL